MASIGRQYIRPGVIIDYDPSAHTVKVRFTDSVGSSEKPIDCPAPHPFSSTGWGIFSYPTKGTRVYVGVGHSNTYFILGTIPLSAYSEDFFTPNFSVGIKTEEYNYPVLEEGEMALQSRSGASIKLDRKGGISYSFGDSLVVQDATDVISETVKDKYSITESGRVISGVVKRDLRFVQNEVEQLTDKLSSVNYNRVLSEIGRNPRLNTIRLTTGINTPTERRRNPALVENHSLTYEFANSYKVGTYDEELKRLQGTTEASSEKSFLSQPNNRNQVRNDALNLGIHNYNALIEKIEGTAVDRYGNILDINRNIINYTNIPKEDFVKRLEAEDVFMRRSIKYHIEINSRKETKSLPARDALIDNGKDHSRWSIDVDGEGLTKINIPASSNTGNIPLLGRYVNSLNYENQDKLNSESYREESHRDINHLAFGDVSGSGIDIPEEYAPPNIVQGEEETPKSFKYRTAHHEITTTASEILGEGNTPIATSIENRFGEENVAPNAGGRSLHSNMDGSLEANIGKDNIDGKSLVLDLQGGIVSRVGKDNNGKSSISQLDGDVLMQVGGDSIEGQEVSTSNNFQLYIKSDAGFHKIEIDNNALVITGAPNKDVVINSKKNLILNAASETFIGGQTISYYGNYSENDRSYTPEQILTRSGTENK